MPEDYKALMGIPRIQTASWGAPVYYVAHNLGCKIERIEETYFQNVKRHRA